MPRCSQEHVTPQRARALAVKLVTRPLLKIQNPWSAPAGEVGAAASFGKSRTTVHRRKPPAPDGPIPMAAFGVVDPAVPTGPVAFTSWEVAGRRPIVAHALTAMARLARARHVGVSAALAFARARNVARFPACERSQSEASPLRRALTGISAPVTSTQVGIKKSWDRAVCGKRRRETKAKQRASKDTFMTTSASM